MTRHKSIRLPEFDYSSAATYFVTQCAALRKPLFGEVAETDMVRSEIGEIASREWAITLELRPTVIQHAFAVMPNHVHALISFNDDGLGASSVASHSNATRPHRQPRSLGTLMSGYKGAVTRAVRDLMGDPAFEVWQPGYHEHIVRNNRSFQTIHEYILDNPRRWAEDRENPANWNRS